MQSADSASFPQCGGFRAVVLAMAAVFCWTLAWYWGTAQQVAGIWWRSETFAHGLVVLPIFAWLVWQARFRIGPLKPEPVLWPVLPAILGGLGWVLGGLASVAAAQHFALFVILVSALVGVLGWRLSRILLFPLVFLFFGVPIGEFMLPTLMHHTAEFTVWALRLSGVPVFHEGLHFVVPNGRWSVVEACSGIRYLIASLMVGSLYAYLNYTSLKRRLIFMLVALCMPIVANWIRAYLIVMLGYLSDNTIAAGVDHILYGWVFFGLVIFLMFWIGARWHEPAAAHPQPVAHGDPRKGGAAWPTVVLLAAAVAAFPPLMKALDAPIAAFSARISLPEPADGWSRLADDAIGYSPIYRGARAESRAVYGGTGEAEPVAAFVAWYAGQREGSEMVAWGNGTVPPESKTITTVRLPRLRNMDGLSLRESIVSTPSGQLLVWQWYRLDGDTVDSDAEVKLRLAVDRLFGRDDDSAVVVLATPLGQAEGAARARLEGFAARHAALIHGALEATARSAGR